MNLASVVDQIAAGGVPYAKVRDKIASGDLLFLHHAFVASWYGVQIEAVQEFTGPFAHIAMFDWVTWEDGQKRLVVYESVVPKTRCVLVSATAEEGFFWLHWDKPITPAEREAIWAELGVTEYSKTGAMSAGLTDTLGPQEDTLMRRWCAKSIALWRRVAGISLGPRYVPTDQFIAAQNLGAQCQYVNMKG